MQELNIEQIEQVSGGISEDVIWGVSLGVSSAFAAGAAAVASPIIAFAFVSGSLISTAMAFDTILSGGGGAEINWFDETRRGG